MTTNDQHRKLIARQSAVCPFVRFYILFLIVLLYNILVATLSDSKSKYVTPQTYTYTYYVVGCMQ